MGPSEIFVLIGFVLGTFMAGITGALFKPGEWYERLNKPSWRPPNRLFAPVWSLLYLTIGVSGWLVWREHGFRDAVGPFTAFTVQLILNAGWSAIFFGLRRIDFALLEIILLWLSVLTTVALFFFLNKMAAFLLVPYLVWVSFAVLLNFSVWRLNVVK